MRLAISRMTALLAALCLLTGTAVGAEPYRSLAPPDQTGHFPPTRYTGTPETGTPNTGTAGTPSEISSFADRLTVMAADLRQLNELDKQIEVVQASLRQADETEMLIEELPYEDGASTSVYGEYLLLQASGADVVYGIPAVGFSPPVISPNGRVGTLDPTFRSGFRVGFQKRLGDSAAMHVSYTHFESNADDSISVTGADVILPVLFVPTSSSMDQLAGSASGSYQVGFQIADIDYRFPWSESSSGHLDVVLGARYAHLQQDVNVNYLFVTSVPSARTNTRIGFDGAGLRIGVDGERYLHDASRLKIYGKAFASVLSGSFGADLNQPDVGTEVTAQWSDDRFVSILEAEVGLIFEHNSFRCVAGYHMSAWFNAVTTNDFVDAVQNDNYGNVQDTISFDGLVARCEFLW